MKQSLEDIDKLIDINLDNISKSEHYSEFFLNFIDENGRKFIMEKAERLAQIMEENDLIRIESTHGQRCDITDFGLNVVKQGGWLKYKSLLEQKEKSDAERKEKEDKLLDLELQIKTFKNKIGRRITIAGFIIAVLSFLISLLTVEIKLSNFKESESKNNYNKEVKDTENYREDALKAK